MFDYTRVDGIMIGRGNLGNPCMIGNIINKLKGEEEKDISNEERLEIIKEHLNLAIKEKGEYIAVREMRKHICWYIKNLRESSKVRDRINKIENTKELIVCLEEYFNTL